MGLLEVSGVGPLEVSGVGPLASGTLCRVHTADLRGGGSLNVNELLGASEREALIYWAGTELPRLLGALGEGGRAGGRGGERITS